MAAPPSLLRRGRTAQPGNQVGVDWSNPICAGLKGLFDASRATELVLGTKASNVSSSAVTSQAGRAADFSGTANQQYPHDPRYAVTGPITVFALMEVRNNTGSTHVISKADLNGFYSPYVMSLGGAGQFGSEPKFYRAGAAASGDAHSNASSMDTNIGKPQTLAVVSASSNSADTSTAAFINGSKVALPFASGSSVAAADDGSSSVWIGRRSDGSMQLDGRIYFVALWSRALSDAEVVSLHQNPWQLFAARRVALPLSLSAGKALPTPRQSIMLPTGGVSASTVTQFPLLYLPRTQQPRTVVGTPDKSVLTLFNAGTMRDEVTGAPASQNNTWTPTYTDSVNGRAAGVSVDSSSNCFYTRPAVVGTGPLTEFMLVWNFNNATSADFVYGCGTYDGASQGFGLALKHSGVSGWGSFDAGSSVALAGAGETLPNGLQFLVATRDGATRRMYRNGALKNSVSATSGNSSSVNFAIGSLQSFGGTFSTTCPVIMAGRLSRCMPPGEVADWARNAFRIFSKTGRPPIWVPWS